MSDEVASLLSLSSIAGDQVDPGYFVLVASDINCSDLLGKDGHQSSSRHKIEGSLRRGVLVATTYAMKIVPPLECSGEPNPSLVTWTSSSLMVLFNRPLHSLRQWRSYCTKIIDFSGPLVEHTFWSLF